MNRHRRSTSRLGPVHLVVVLLVVAAVPSVPQVTTVDSLLRRAAWLSRTQQNEEAGHTLTQAWQASKTDADRARVRLAQGNLFSGSLGSGSEATTASPTPKGRSAHSVSLSTKDNRDHSGKESAELYYREAIELAAADPVTLTIAVNNLAVLWIGSQRCAQAAELLERHLDIVPEEAIPLFFYNYGLALEGTSRLPEAFAAYVRAAISQPDFTEAHQGVRRLTGHWLLPDNATQAVELARATRQAGRLDQAEAFLETFLFHVDWFDLPIYEDGLISELLYILSSDRRSADGFDETWLGLLDTLQDHLPEQTAAKIQSIGWALRPPSLLPTSTEDLWSAWRWPPSERKRFSLFLKRLGDRELRQEKWKSALDRYSAAWDVDLENLDAATYLLNVLAVGPRELDPDGELASAALLGLHLTEFDAATPEVAGTFLLAGEALARREHLEEAMEAWKLAREISDGDWVIGKELAHRIESVRRQLEVEDRDPPPRERTLQEPQLHREDTRPGPKLRVMVVDFENAAPGAWGELGRHYAERLREDLRATGRFLVTEPEDLASPMQLASLTGANLVISGKIIDVSRYDHTEGGFGFLGKFRVSGVTVLVNVRLFRGDTGTILSSTHVEGSTRTKNVKLRNSGLGAVTDKMRALEATTKAVEKALPSLLEAMGQIPWQGKVVRVTGDKVIINAGSADGVSRRLELQIIRQGERIIDPSTGEALGYLEEVIGRIRIEEVQKRISTGRAVVGSTKTGDIARTTESH